MPEDIRQRSAFLMVTDTAMVRKDGCIYAFGPVVRELEVFSQLFHEIEWIGFDSPHLYNDPIMLPVPKHIKCILLKSSGGDNFSGKVSVLIQVPIMFWAIFKRLFSHQVIHTRAPSSPAFIAALLSFFFQRKIWWHKYAGNWGQTKAPFFYGLQRSWLKKAVWSKVTINGHWPDQLMHCLSFENPCLDEEERRIGAACIQAKDYTQSLNLCFVGRLEIAKGIDLLLEALRGLDVRRIESLHIIGDGPLWADTESAIAELPIKVQLYGSLSRGDVGRVMEACHILVLPSKAEGFPKVIAEGANYGCIPVVSDISGIAQYVQHGENGFLLSPERLEKGMLQEDLQTILSQYNLKSLAEAAYTMAADFTFARYRERIQGVILE